MFLFWGIGALYIPNLLVTHLHMTSRKEIEGIETEETANMNDESDNNGQKDDSILLCRIAQVLLLLAYVMFPNSTLQDIIKAIQLFPMRCTKEDDAPVGCIRIACILRFIQGNFAIIVVFLLVMSAESTLDIILNFTAVHFITELDKIRFIWPKFEKGSKENCEYKAS